MTQTLAGDLVNVGITTALENTDSKCVIAVVLWMYIDTVATEITQRLSSDVEAKLATTDAPGLCCPCTYAQTMPGTAIAGLGQMHDRDYSKR